MLCRLSRSRRPGARLIAACLSTALAGGLVVLPDTGLAQQRPRPPQGDARTAPAQATLTVSAIRVEGNQRIESDTIRSYLSVEPGTEVDASAIDRSLKTLFATGLFSDVSIKPEGRELVVRVVENPIVNRVAFEGNSKITKETLTKEAQMKARVVFTRARVQADVTRILELYRRSGKFAATVEPKIIQLPQNRVDLVYEINEGETTGVARINFIGNNAYSDGRLREEIATKQTRWWRFLSSSDNYDPDRMNYDAELMRRFYLSRGYADFRVISKVAELTRDREDFFITFTMEEGDIYNFGEIELKTNIKALDPTVLKSVVLTEKGDYYNAELIDKTIDALTYQAGLEGYAFVEVIPRVQRDKDKKIISITYEINEGPRVYIEKINIIGNVRTLDKVIRREFRLAEGDAFSSAGVERTKTRLKGLGFFKETDVTRENGTAGDRAILKAEVEEQSTGELSIGFGYSSYDQLIGDISVTERNLLGRGQQLRIGLSLSRYRRSIDLGFTEPYFLDRPLAAGIDIYDTLTDYQSESSFDQQSTGFALRTGWEMGEYLKMGTRYVLRNDKITNVPFGASLAIFNLQGSYLTSLIGYSMSYDRRDDFKEPTRGYLLTWAQDFAGLGGNVRYLRQEATAGWWHPIPWFDKVVGSVKGQVGFIQGVNQQVKITDRFFLGGDSLRGFKTAGVGPRDIQTGDALGGNLYMTATAEATFPLGLPKEFGIMGSVFTEAGSLSQSDSVGLYLRDDTSLRLSTGVGLSWDSPFGLIKVYLSYPLLREEYDKTENFRFNVGTKF